MRFIHKIPALLADKLYVCCPVHKDTILMRISVNVKGFKRGMCEACVREIFNLKRGIQDGYETQTKRLRGKRRTNG